MTTSLLLGGRIYAPTAPDATAMAVTDGIVTWVGQDTVGQTLYGDADEVLHLDGAFVAPAFVDAHVHATATGLSLTGLDFRDCRSLAEFLSMIRSAVRNHPDGVLWGHGWDDTHWSERRAPTRTELDEAAEGRPVYLSRIDVHSALATSALIDLAPEARHADGWSEQGPVTRQAHHHIRQAAKGSITPAQRRQAQLSFLDAAAAAGIASVHECGGPDVSGIDDLRDLITLAESESAPDVVGYWGEIGAFDVLNKIDVRGLAGDIFVDGALGSRTAALLAPYTDDPAGSGNLYLHADDLTDHIVSCTRAGVQAGFHVIGDAAVAEVITAFSRAEHIVGTPALASARHRLEHAEMMTTAQAAQLASWGIVASVQPAFDAHWGGQDGLYAQRLGQERADTLNPFAAMASAGVLLALGSDSPVTRLDPWATVRAAVHHHNPQSGISPRAAFTAHTRGGWRAAGVDDGLTGTLAPGAPATYAIWRADEFVVAAPDARVQRWSTDPRARVPALPALNSDASLPTCLRTVLRGSVLFEQEGALL